MAKARKYPTYKMLAKAFQKGELEDYILVLDNDACRLGYRGHKPTDLSDDAWDVEWDKRNDDCCEWFEGNGYRDIEPLCKVAGIPAEWC